MSSQARARATKVRQDHSPKRRQLKNYGNKELKDPPLNDILKIILNCWRVEQPPADDSKWVQHEKVTLTPPLGVCTTGVQKSANTNKLCARNLCIAHSEDPKFWIWTSDEDGSEIARLIQARWLDISGRFRTITLSLETTYEIVLLYKLEEKKSAGVNRFPVNVELRLPNGTERKDIVRLDGSSGSWQGIPLGEFNMSPENLGEVAFRIYEHSQSWKCGLAIKSISFRSKKT